MQRRSEAVRGNRSDSTPVRPELPGASQRQSPSVWLRVGRGRGFSSGGFTRFADRMAKEGLIRRDPDPNDRRAALAVLTDKGAEALDRAMTKHVSQLRTHVSGPLSTADRRHLERALRILRDASTPA
ncbi:MarR family winged helix-turn-helix transcriptional regulator [Streptomyces coeruleorubidus]|uniref:MarR family winged helix-turn-helix transcriptional regulator n=1 Tax=Streptomyces coeruleorubidus TaxID=116188 RepID=UPI0036B99D06